MNSKNYSSNFSGALVKETLRRLWILGAFSAAAYFCTIIIPLLVNKSDIYSVGSMITGGSTAIFFTAAFPVLIAMSVWSFLNSQGPVATFHSLPYSRKQIYNSSNLAGLILTCGPVILTGLIIMLTRIVHGPFYDETLEAAELVEKADVLPFSAIFLWIAFILILNIAVYFAAVLAAMVSGLPGIRIAVAYIFMLAIPAALIIVNGLSEVMLFGYVTPDWLEYLAHYTSPITALFNNIEGAYARNVIMIYLTVSVVLYFAGLIAYKKRPLEKAGDTLVFRWCEPFFNCLAGFFGATIGGLGFYYLFSEPETWTLYAGAAIGGILAFLAIDMIIQKTPKIKGFGKSLGLVGAAVIILFAAFAIDIIGFQTDMPDTDEVKDVCIQGLIYSEELSSEIYVDDPAFIDEVRGLHTELTGTERMSKNIYNGRYTYKLDDGSLAYIEGEIPDDRKIESTYAPDEYSFVQIDYRLKNGRHVLREYSVYSSWLKENDHARKIAENRSFREALFEILTWDADDSNFVSIEINPYPGKGSFGKYGSEIHEKDKMSTLVKALQEDIASLSADKMNWSYSEESERLGNSMWVVVTRNIPYKEIPGEYLEEHDLHPDPSGNAQIESWYLIDEDYARSMALIKEWGCYESAIVTADDVHSIRVVKYDFRNDEMWASKPVVIEDKEKIKEVMETGENYVNYEDRYYEIEICDGSMEDCSAMWYYYTEKTAPAWMKEENYDF